MQQTLPAPRKPFQGVKNIIEFNWHFYVIAIISIELLLLLAYYSQLPIQLYAYWAATLAIVALLLPTLISFYVYDCTTLYAFKGLPLRNKPNSSYVNIHAGFDETSAILHQKYPLAKWLVLDFYSPTKHTELSIKRARKKYAPYPGTLPVSTHNLPIEPQSVNAFCLIFAAHEIRDAAERVLFFKQLKQALKPGGQIIIIEHLRNLPNFLAYNFGCFHFLSLDSWQRTITQSGLVVQSQVALNPFVVQFILTHDNTT